MHQVAPTRLLRKHKFVGRGPSPRLGVVGGCNVRSVKAEAIEPHQLAGVATVLRNQWPSLRRFGQTDDVTLGAGEEVSQVQRLLDQRCVATCTHEAEAQIGHIDEGLALLRLRPEKQVNDSVSVCGLPIAMASSTARASASSKRRGA